MAGQKSRELDLKYAVMSCRQPSSAAIVILSKGGRAAWKSKPPVPSVSMNDGGAGPGTST